MDPRKIFPSLKHSIPFHAELVPLCGSVIAALYLRQILYWTDKQRDPKGWIFKRVRRRRDPGDVHSAYGQSLLDELGISYAQWQTANRLLTQRGLIESRYFRSEHRLCVRANLEGIRLAAIAHGLAPSVEAGAASQVSRPEQVKNLDQAGQEPLPGKSGKSTSLIGTNIDYTENTSEYAAAAAKGDDLSPLNRGQGRSTRKGQNSWGLSE